MKCNSILIVKDDMDIRSALVELLNQDGYIAQIACNGQEGIDLLAKLDHPTLVFLDLLMPVMGGMTFLAELKQRGLEKDAEVVVISASTLAKQVKDFTVMTKPFDSEDFLSFVHDHANRNLNPAS